MSKATSPKLNIDKHLAGVLSTAPQAHVQQTHQIPSSEVASGTWGQEVNMKVENKETS